MSEPIAEINECLVDLWGRDLGGDWPMPSEIIVSWPMFIKLGRFWMPKRKWRRWRGKQRAMMRAMR